MLEPVLRQAFPDRAQRMIRELDRWCRESPPVADRDPRWFDNGGGKVSDEWLASFQCSFCERTLLHAQRLIGLRRTGGGQPHFTLEGYRHPVDRVKDAEIRPPMICSLCLDAYHQRFNDEAMFQSPLPDGDLLLNDVQRAMRSRQVERADDIIRELEKRKALAVPRAFAPGVCTVCQGADQKVVPGRSATICSRCVNMARYHTGAVVALAARARAT